MLFGKMICEGCGTDCTGGLWAFGLGTRGQLNNKQTQQLNDFRKKYGKDCMVWCWDCAAQLFGARPLAEQKTQTAAPAASCEARAGATANIGEIEDGSDDQ